MGPHKPSARPIPMVRHEKPSIRHTTSATVHVSRSLKLSSLLDLWPQHRPGLVSAAMAVGEDTSEVGLLVELVGWLHCRRRCARAWLLVTREVGGSSREYLDFEVYSTTSGRD